MNSRAATMTRPIAVQTPAIIGMFLFTLDTLAGDRLSGEFDAAVEVGAILDVIICELEFVTETPLLDRIGAVNPVDDSMGKEIVPGVAEDDVMASEGKLPVKTPPKQYQNPLDANVALPCKFQ